MLNPNMISSESMPLLPSFWFLSSLNVKNINDTALIGTKPRAYTEHTNIQERLYCNIELQRLDHS